jgi:hypothetical protein
MSNLPFCMHRPTVVRGGRVHQGSRPWLCPWSSRYNRYCNGAGDRAGGSPPSPASVSGRPRCSGLQTATPGPANKGHFRLTFCANKLARELTSPPMGPHCVPTACQQPVDPTVPAHTTRTRRDASSTTLVESRGIAAIHREDRAVHEARRIRAQPGDRLGALFGVAQPILG